MTYEEALKVIGAIEPDTKIDSIEKLQALMLGMEAMEKQIAKKPITKFERCVNGNREWFCVCGEKIYEIWDNIELGHKQDYCECCGTSY